MKLQIILRFLSALPTSRVPALNIRYTQLTTYRRRQRATFLSNISSCRPDTYSFIDRTPSSVQSPIAPARAIHQSQSHIPQNVSRKPRPRVLAPAKCLQGTPGTDIDPALQSAHKPHTGAANIRLPRLSHTSRSYTTGSHNTVHIRARTSYAS